MGLNNTGVTDMIKRAFITATLLGMATATSCAYRAPIPPGDVIGMALSSTAFENGRAISSKYTCDGSDISPPLAWSEAPAGTASFTLIMDDPDALGGVFTHWIIFNLPPDTQELAEGITKAGELANGARQGKNDFGKTGYNGPCPPPGKAHHYHLTLYALDTKLELAAGISKKQLLDAMEGHILGQGKLVGTYQR